MTNILIELVHELRSINLNKRFFKKFFKWRAIRSAKSKLYKCIQKDEYNAIDIINTCTMMSTARVMDLVSNTDMQMSVDLLKNASTLPIVGCIDITMPTMEVIFKAHMDSDIDMEGTISMRWVINTEDSRSKAYSRDIKILYKEYKTTPRDYTDLLEAETFIVLANAMVICIESVIDGVQRRYLNENNKRISQFNS